MKDDNHKFIFEFYNKKEDKIFTFNVISNKIDIDGVFYCHMVMVDVTELVEANHKLLKEKDRVESSEKFKDAFLSNMSHEIRTPMMAIVGFADIIKYSIGGQFVEYSRAIIQNVDYLATLIDNIIMITRLDSDQIKIKYTSFDLMEEIKDLQVRYYIKIKDQNKNLKIVLDNTDQFMIETDQYMIDECLQRLLDNSVKFSNGGEIHMGFYIQDKNVTIYVKDEGIGIENKFHEIIFDRFRKINRQTLGAGLGLSIFRSYVKLLGAKYNLTSKPGQGTTVSFTLGVKPEPQYEETKKVEDKNTDILEDKKILVAEDLEVNQQLIYEMLLPYKVDIIKCMDGNETVEKFNEIREIDLVLMDLDMPFMDGYEATKLIREKDKIVPIIAQTAYTQKENREKARKIGFTDFLTKPITRDSLLKIILKHIK
jgi:CheY-like chemotaxis protein